MSQYKNIPQPEHQRNVSQVNLLENFQYLCTALGGASVGVPNGMLPVDHQASGDNVANPRDGFHNQCSYVAQSTPASLVNAVNGQTSNGIEYVKLDGNSNGQIRFRNNLMDQPVTFLKAAVRFQNNTTIIGNSFNVSGVTHPSTGTYVVTFSTAMPTANYMVFPASVDSTGAGRIINYSNLNTTDFTITTYSLGNTLPINVTELSVMVIGFF